MIKRIIKYIEYKKNKKIIFNSTLFDEKYYLITYPDIRHADVDALNHFVKTGAYEERNPNNSFNTSFYLNEHEDVKKSKTNPLVHYILYGQNEGRLINSFQKEKAIILSSGMFDDVYYYTTYKDVQTAKIDALTHYLQHGANENRNPSQLFNTSWYKKQNPDVVNSGINPLLHYLQFGKKEGRSPHPKALFNKYKNNNSDTLNYYYNDNNLHVTNGNIAHINGALSVLVCAHIAGKKLFGGERSLIDILDGMNTLGFNVIVAIPVGSSTSYINELRTRAVKLYHLNYGWWKQNTNVSENSIKVFSSIIASDKIDAVHVNTIMLREPILASNRMHIPVAVHVRELINADKDLCAYIDETPENIIKYIINHADFIIANSHATKKSFHKLGATFVVPNTIDINKFNIKNTLQNNIINIALISSNIPKKGIYDFIELAKNLYISTPSAKLLLIGPENEHIIKLKKEQEKGNIPHNLEFTGYCEPIEALEKANIVVNLSSFQESFGRTVLEAMAASCPVVAYNWGALPELISNNETGYLVPLGDTASVAKHIQYLCNNQSLIISMGKKAREIAVHNYSQKRYAEYLQTAYKPIIEKSNIDSGSKYVLHMRNTKYNKKVKKTKLNIAYFLWHFPVPSETFVLNELRILIAKGHNVRVFCCQSPYSEFKPDIPIVWEKINTPQDLASRLKETEIDIVHSHFIYPTVTNMVWPACETAKIPFTFIAHSQDIFRYTNIQNNKIENVTKSKYCKNIFVPSIYHMKYVLEQGVPKSKICINPNGIDPSLYVRAQNENSKPRPSRSICAIHRFVEKKGIEFLILAGNELATDNIEIHIYGYGDLQSQYESIIDKHQIKNVHLHGPVKSREEILDIFQSHDLFVCPSVRASDGDMDGIPTILMEAMASGLPVLTTGISGIPDLVHHEVNGFICDGSSNGIVNTVRHFYNLADVQVNSIINAAKLHIDNHFHVSKLTQTLLRSWSNETIDIIIVTWNNLPELEEVIRRIYLFTPMPFHLVICDNGSKQDVIKFLRKLYAIKNNITVVFNNENVKVGPGTNIAMEYSHSEYSIYVCGKEGFILNYGWEKSIIEYMDSNPEVGIAGTLGFSPSYLYGRQYSEGISEFPHFRNKKFATQKANRKFFHVQGGFFVLRRAMFDEIGGFNLEVPHNYTDVEYSYYVESCNWKLGALPNMLAIYNKTRPDIYSRIDENTSAIHPPTLLELPLLDKIIQRKVEFCNLCKWHGEQFDEKHTCPQCKSSPKDRTLYRFIAESDLTHQRLPAIGVNLGNAIKVFWTQQFQGGILDNYNLTNSVENSLHLNYATSSMKLIYIDAETINKDDLLILINEIVRLLHKDGILILRSKDNKFIVNEISSIYPLSQNESVSYSSSVLKYDFVNLFIFKKNNEL